jgi:hypothetical protein
VPSGKSCTTRWSSRSRITGSIERTIAGRPFSVIRSPTSSAGSRNATSGDYFFAAAQLIAIGDDSHASGNDTG